LFITGKFNLNYVLESFKINESLAGLPAKDDEPLLNVSQTNNYEKKITALTDSVLFHHYFVILCRECEVYPFSSTEHKSALLRTCPKDSPHAKSAERLYELSGKQTRNEQ